MLSIGRFVYCAYFAVNEALIIVQYIEMSKRNYHEQLWYVA
jgi:hypothetical protein